MPNNHVASFDSGEPPFKIDGSKISLVLAVLANILQVFAILFQASTETKTFLFLLASLVGLGILLLVMQWWPKSRAPFTVFAAGTLLAIGLLFWVTSSGAATLWRTSENAGSGSIYYIRVFTYANDATDGEIETQHPLSEITIMTRDQYGHTAIYKTGINGTQAIPIESVPPDSFATVAIGACGLFQTHHISREATSPATAQIVQIGIESAQIQGCRS
jgi:hypothetical protein